MDSANNRGFSLIELMIAVAIMAIISAIAIPSTISWREERKLQGAARAFMADMQLARLKAIREADAVSIVLIPGTGAAGSYSIFVDLNQNSALDAGEEQVRNITMSSGITLSTNFPGAPASIRFNSRGMPNFNGRATFQNPAGNSLMVFLNRIGRLRVQ